MLRGSDSLEDYPTADSLEDYPTADSLEDYPTADSLEDYPTGWTVWYRGAIKKPGSVFLPSRASILKSGVQG